MNRFVLKMLNGSKFLGGRGAAHSARRDAETRLSRTGVQVCLDFAGVTGVSHSFADELLTPLYELLGNSFSDRVVFANCSTPVREAFELVAELHGLGLPRFEGTARPSCLELHGLAATA